MSILGLTLDHGASGFLDAFDPGRVCNQADAAGRYAWGRQPQVALWNLQALAHAMAPLIGDERAVWAALETYRARLPIALGDRFAAKLGLTSAEPDDAALVDDLLRLMADAGADFTITFRRLSGFKPKPRARNAALRELFNDRSGFDAWALRYAERLAREETSDAERAARMNRVNPKFVLRDHLAEAAIGAACAGDFSEVARLHAALQRPFDEQPEAGSYADPRPSGPSTTRCPVHDESMQDQKAGRRSPRPGRRPHAAAATRMKLFFDFLPLILFFGAFKYADANADEAARFATEHLGFVVSGGIVAATEAPVLLATVVVMVATLLQIGILLALRKSRHHAVGHLRAVAVLGGATVWFHDATFIKWKPSALYWAMGVVLWASQALFGKNLLQALVGTQLGTARSGLAAPEHGLGDLLHPDGLPNIYVAYTFSISTWATFKLFGRRGMMLVFMLAQGFYSRRHLKDEDPSRRQAAGTPGPERGPGIDVSVSAPRSRRGCAALWFRGARGDRRQPHARRAMRAPAKDAISPSDLQRALRRPDPRRATPPRI